jgi:1-phosphatidylinositol-3-phosphate 5-kinase
LCFTDARRTLLDSLSLDTKFLNSQGIMDYSLLLGLDLERKVLVSGLVDAVGSFGLWKRLESASKVGLKGKGREGEVTVVRTISAILWEMAERSRRFADRTADTARAIPREV